MTLPATAAPAIGDGVRVASRLLALIARALPPDSGVTLALAGDASTAGTSARIVFASPGALGRSLWPLRPDALGDAHLRGEFDIEGDIAAVARAGSVFDLGRLTWAERMAIASGVLKLRRIATPARALTRRAKLHGRRHSVARDRAAVRFHYDVGNAFYALWLDARMTYSCAYFASPEMALDAAQEAKLDLICRKLDLRPGQRLLDIGCGWGSLVLYAGEHYGVEAVGVTLSEEQAQSANEQARDRRLADRVRTVVLDYRELASLGQFDAVASVGMFEHVGRSHLPDYFAAAECSLRPGGFFLNHGIAVAKDASGRRRPRIELKADFIGSHVFPDGELVGVAEVMGYAQGAGFELLEAESLRPHYALTLAAWVSRLEAAKDQAIALVGDEVYRTWRLYMAGSRIGFERGDLDVVQLLLAKPNATEPAPRPLSPWWTAGRNGA